MDIKEPWETEEIDLELRHYRRHSLDVLKRVKLDIEKYLSNPAISQQQREIYSAIYNGIEYYIAISHLHPSDFATDDSFLDYAIGSFNNDLQYLSKNYQAESPFDSPVITMTARIKSPISFFDKMRAKVTDYINEGRDFRYFNESLRDLIGARVVVTPPAEIKAKGPQAECEYLYKVFYDFATYHGVGNKDSETLDWNEFRFMPVNTRYNPNKQEKIRRRPSKNGFSDSIKTDSGLLIYIPYRRIPEIEDPQISNILKDYIRYPKYSGYQSLHICVTPYYSDYIEHPQLPSYIIPPEDYDYRVEYQFRTDTQNEFAEHGKASHSSVYKPDRAKFHRLAVPFYIEVDGPYDLADNSYHNPVLRKSIPPSKRLKLRNFAESIYRFYGYTFQEMFGLSFKDFRDTFTTDERDSILDGTKVVRFNSETQSYYLEDVDLAVYITEAEQARLKEAIKDDSKLVEQVEQLGFLDNSVDPTTDEAAHPIHAKTTPITRVVTPVRNKKSFEYIPGQTMMEGILDKSDDIHDSVLEDK